MTPSNPIAPPLEGLVTRQEVLDAHGWKNTTLASWVSAGVIAPVAKVGGKTFWKMPTAEEAAAIKAEMKRRLIESASRGGKNRQRAASRKSDAPEGLLSTEEMVETLGITLTTLKRWRRRELIAPVWTCPKFKTNYWETPKAEDIAEIRRKLQEPKPRTASPRPKGVKPRTGGSPGELPTFIPAPTPPKPKQKPVRIGMGLPYEEAIAKGKANVKWANILGFNLWRDGNTYKAESVREVPSSPWEHCERHFLKGDSWESRIVRPNGEVIT